MVPCRFSPRTASAPYSFRTFLGRQGRRTPTYRVEGMSVGELGRRAGVMRSSEVSGRFSVRFAMTALLALALVCLGALFPGSAITATTPVSGSALAGTAGVAEAPGPSMVPAPGPAGASAVAPAPAVAAPQLTANDGTACNPGRGDLHTEAASTPPRPSPVLPAPGPHTGSAITGGPVSISLVQAVDRTPSSLTHLDLGICRT